MNTNVSEAGPVVLVRRGSPSFGKVNVTLLAVHAGAAVGGGTTTTGAVVGLGVATAAFVAAGRVGVRVAVRATADVTVGKGVTVAG